jgi:hypothetical protein
MPLEGHYRRVNTPVRVLTLRERRVLLWGATATAATILILILATVGGGHAALGQGCIRVGVPGRTGGEVVAGCGKEAKMLCSRATRFEGVRAEMVVDACHARQIDFEPASTG